MFGRRSVSARNEIGASAAIASSLTDDPSSTYYTYITINCKAISVDLAMYQPDRNVW